LGRKANHYSINNMEPVTVGAIVRSFAGLIMNEDMSPKQKQISIILIAVLLTEGYALAHIGFSFAVMFDNLLNGLEAGLSALGIYHLTQKVDNSSIQALG
jgi:hypothetical protein